MTYKEMIEIADERKLTVEEFDEFFKPISYNDTQVIYDYWEQAKEKIDKLIAENGNKFHQHLWTVVDGEGDSLIALNGSHMFNRLGYIVCSEPWGDGTDEDKNIYIEAEY